MPTTLASGVTVGHYEVGAHIGAGGMGEVYQARDTTLDRSVAIKVLPEAFSRDTDRLARLEREAKHLASLNHPNIAAIYSLEAAGDLRLLVMELVPGRTLAERLEGQRAQGTGQGSEATGQRTEGGLGAGLPTAEALAIAQQIAQALEAAHAKGIIHRDLKPANVKITPEDRVKLLDFGLAKALGDDVSSAADLSYSPTMAAGRTAAGIILGTAAYMSPEQARGKTVDTRTDIWAFGCVLYEMLSGSKAFPGDTVTDVLAAVVRAEPDWQALPTSTPPAMTTLLRRCLQKDVGRRLHHIADARLEIEDAMAWPTVGSSAQSASSPTRRGVRIYQWAPWALTAAMAVGGLALFETMRRNPSTPGEIARLEMSLPANVEFFTGSLGSVDISPEGNRIAYAGSESGVRQLYLRSLDEFDTQVVKGSSGVQSCFFSPDGKSIGFTTNDGVLKKLSLQDGLIVVVATGLHLNRGGAWTAGDQMVFARDEALWMVPSTGGTPQRLTTPDANPGDVAIASPFALPTGNAILFTSGAGANNRIESLSLSTHERKVVVERATLPIYTPTGHLLFFRDGELLAVPFDAARLTVVGQPISVLNLPAGVSGLPALAVSRTGALVYAPTSATGRLVWVSRDGAEQPLNDALRSYANPRVSPDGRRIVVQSNGDLWMQDATRGTFTRLTLNDAPPVSYPTWTPDGQQIVFRTGNGMRVIAADGSGREEAIASTSINDYPNSVSPDGKTVTFARLGSPTTSADVYIVALEAKAEPRPLVQTPAYEGGSTFSPDGRWVAYVSNESGQTQVYVRPFPAPDRKWQVSTEGGTHPVWNRNGKELFYRIGYKLMVVEMTGGAEPTLAQPRQLFDLRYAFGANVSMANYDVSPDGRRFVMIKEESSANHLNIVLNWFDQLTRRAPVNVR